jgi:hypothetical protein
MRRGGGVRAALPRPLESVADSRTSGRADESFPLAPAARSCIFRLALESYSLDAPAPSKGGMIEPMESIA